MLWNFRSFGKICHSWLYYVSAPTHYCCQTAPTATVAHTKCLCFFPTRQSQSSSTSNRGTFMEVVRSVLRPESMAGARIAISAGGKDYTYKQLVSFAGKITGLLNSFVLKQVGPYSKSGCIGGARVGIVASPSVDFVASVLATWFSGGVVVPLAISYPEAELLHVMNDSEISFVLSTEDHREIMQGISSKCGAQFVIIPPVSSVLPEDKFSLEVLNDHDKDENPALIVYTSGTTGKPKGVVHTHGSIASQVRMLSESWEISPTDRVLHCLPLHHVHGLFNVLLAPLFSGSTVEFMDKFSVTRIWQRWRECYPAQGIKADNPITVFSGVPTMYTRLIQGYEAMDSDVQTASASAARQLRLMMCGSSALPVPVMERWESITGHRLLERYGMTEFVMALSNPLHGERRTGTVGMPFPGIQVRLAKDENETEPEDVGELCVKSPSLFKEYWKLPQVTKESFTSDGFFKTGDACRRDEDGYYIILGRLSADIMKVGGFKLSALEIESVVLENPAVAECCILGLPEKAYGEAVCAIIVPEVGINAEEDSNSKPVITLEELRIWAKDKLAPYKLPTRLIVWDSFPRNAMGKVNKKEIKKLLIDHQ